MNLLHLEDSPTDAVLTQVALRREWPQCRIRHVCTAGEYQAALSTGGFDVILSDYTLAGFDGLSALALAREKAPATPFLFLSGTIGEERAVDALKRGATDYVTKDRPARLVAAIRQALTHAEELRRRREAEARLREQALLLDRARDAIIATELDHRITYWNASAERLYGRKAADVLGRKLHELGLGHDAQHFNEARAQILAHGEWRGEFRLAGLPREAAVIESRWSLVFENDGRPRTILHLEADVTERRKLEAQLQRAQRLESIGTLAGGVAHDLNNVFTPILLMLDLLGAKLGADEDRRLLEATKASAAHGAALVEQLLAFARGADGKRRRLDPAAALTTVQSLLAQSLPPSIHSAVRMAETVWPIEADATQVNQALLNLGLNARDAMPDGGTIELSARNVTVSTALAAVNPGVKPGPFVCLSVRDSGTGIPAGVLEQIFDPFFTTKPAGKGTGLGLSVVAGILRSHDGFVQVESEPGRGATFHLYFPAQPPPLQPASPPPAAVASAFGEATGGILLIDDEPVVRDTLQLLLQRAGYRVFPAGDARSGIAAFEQRAPDIGLVITDMMLPDRPGTEVVKTLRGRRAQLPIIAISGMMATGDFDELLELSPPVECLAKPLSPATLLGAVRRRLAGVAAP